MLRCAVRWCLLFVLSCSLMPVTSLAQQSTASNAVVPLLVNYSGVLTGANGKPMAGTVGVTFSLYAEQGGWSAIVAGNPERAAG